MQKTKSILVFLLWLSSGTILAQVGQQRVDAKEAASLDAEREKHALLVLAKLTEKVIVSAADAMPADKYGFSPADGEFKGVRTFSQMVKHLSATNYILAAAALGEEPPADAGDELGPEAVGSWPRYEQVRASLPVAAPRRSPCVLATRRDFFRPATSETTGSARNQIL